MRCPGNQSSQGRLHRRVLLCIRRILVAFETCKVRTTYGDVMESYLTAEISASAVRANLELLRSLCAPGTKLCPAVKANCYGLGVDLLLGAISELADALAVATPEEALRLRSLGYERQILTMFSPIAGGNGIYARDALSEQITEGITLTVVSTESLAGIAEAARTVRAEAELHVMIDTGMGRSGIRYNKAPSLIEQIRGTECVRLTGLYTHFATADVADKEFTQLQLKRFLDIVDAVGGHAGLMLHSANSAATIDLPETHLDMIRPGISVYGYQPSDEMNNKPPLRPALRLCGRLMQIKDIPPGEGVGYGQTYTFERGGKIGLVPIGYADGYRRTLSNNATMRISGRDVPVRGRVSMDQTIIDLSDVPQASVGDEVEIISNDPAAPHCVENIARLANTIPNEIITGLCGRVNRVLVD